jgi:hypothetical protein
MRCEAVHLLRFSLAMTFPSALTSTCQVGS